MQAPVTARLYLDPWCVLCRFVEPGVRWWFARRGVALAVFKVRGRVARQVNGHAAETIDLPGLPALRVGTVVLVGTGILGFLREAVKGR